MDYRAPVAEMAFTLRHVAGFDRSLGEGLHGELTIDVADAVLEEAARFANEVVAPLNRVGDREGVRFENGIVAMPPGYREAYGAWVDAGWNALAGPPEHGGQGLPMLVAAACTEMWNSACMAFGLGPLLTAGGVEALHRHGSDALRDAYLGKLVSGAWTATMNLTEPQAGSDLAGLRTKAEPQGDGTYRIRGEKIYITWGDHDLTDNIAHLVLARLPEAPAGTRGISLFLVPKILPDGTRNDVRCAGVEHKLGIHASPTCTMVFGENAGAVGWLIGQPDRGLNCMFTMMNNARLGIGLQGVAIAERATQQAMHFSQERRQGRSTGSQDGPSVIIAHPDVQRMLLTMKALTSAARGICYTTADAIDRAHRAPDEAGRRLANDRASLLTPVAKAFSTDIGVEVASIGIQVHGGMGYIEEAGAAQHLRDARITTIYEGTNGIQAIDLVLRKLPLAGGVVVRDQIADMRKAAEELAGHAGLESAGRRIGEAVDALDRTTESLLSALSAGRVDEALAGATPYLRLFGLAQGGACLAMGASAAFAAIRTGDNNPLHAGFLATTRFFADNLAVDAEGLARRVRGGTGFPDWRNALVA